MRLEPRPGKFYYLAGNNLADNDSVKTTSKDYQRQNTVTAELGKDWGPVSGALGFIQSRAGVEGRYRPFQDQPVPVLNRLELMAQAFDFARDDTIKGRRFTGANYTAGGFFKLNPWLTVGAEAQDIAQTSDISGVEDLSFEDKDIAYLLGL